ncbi:Hypothetical predicted protein [Paramuricea clavata]|uniref:Uncharacterized protein n=1 Tax=Paramuricea clavata TaxID=317549 RepID=A0A7D9DJ77_PARCT|nr:Hypothetical predicted protein [Paramuricea clavata]
MLHGQPQNISNGSDSLRQQFQLLQEQHKKKLLLRKQKLSTRTEVTEEQKPEYLNGGNSHGSIEDLDNLELQLNSDSNDGFSIQQTFEYDNKIRELKDENGRLYKLLAERDEEMRILRKQVNQERQAIAGIGPASDTAANRIMELSKKNRELASEIEKERRKAKQLSRKLTEMENQNSSMAAQVTKQSQGSKDATDQEKGNSQVLEEKLKQAIAKMAEYRNQCEILKKEAKIAQKVIAKECGEGVNVAAVLNDPSGWRGRQQQITTLQNKVNELKAQLNDAMRSKQGLPTNGSQNFNAQRVMTPSFHDEKHKQMLRKIEKNKKEEYEKVSGELHLLNEEHQKLQTKFDAAKTRNKILTSELKGLKEQIKMLVEKGAHDDELIAALMREQERLKKTVEKKNSQIAERSQSRQEKVQQDTELVATLTQLCKEREEKVTQLERELNSLAINLAETPARQHTRSADKATITDELANDRIPSPLLDYQQNSSETVVSKTHEVEAQPRRRRIVRSSSGKNSSASALPPTPPRSGSGRRKTSGMSSDGRYMSGSTQFEEYQTLYEATKVERDKLVELVALFQHREKEVQESTCKISSEVKTLQRQNVELEKRLARVQEQRSAQDKNSKKYQRQRTGTSEERSTEPYYVEELETQLAIQKDDNDALKEALESTLEGKKEDFQYYQDIVEQTKRVFLQGLHQYRQTSSPTTTSSGNTLRT